MAITLNSIQRENLLVVAGQLMSLASTVNDGEYITESADFVGLWVSSISDVICLTQKDGAGVQVLLRLE